MKSTLNNLKILKNTGKICHHERDRSVSPSPVSANQIDCISKYKGRVNRKCYDLGMVKHFLNKMQKAQALQEKDSNIQLHKN